MAISPTATVGCLHRADGSASLNHYSTKVLASVNGPMEIRARDEHYSKAVVDIVVRPSIGVATYREKYLESRLSGVLEPIIFATMAPRTLIQIVVQIVQVGNLGVQAVAATTAHEYTPLLILPHIITASLLALLDAGVPLTATLDTVLVTVNSTALFTSGDEDVMTDDTEPEVHINPYSTPHLLHTAKSTHVIAYSTAVSRAPDWEGREAPYRGEGDGMDEPEQGDIVLVESEGDFTWEEWQKVEDNARRECMGANHDSSQIGKRIGRNEESELRWWGKGMMGKLVRETVRQKVGRDLRWRK
ncbi:ribosomal protein S5 domain 2-type protein [Kalaharituber pfeilii]|nr:ribosomal protein S5 domain 2-type protein [Kalaharituber pfeilii]